MIRPLILDEEAKAKAAAVMAYAEAHPYRPAPGLIPAGDNPRFVANFAYGYRAVFTYTHSERVWRHLSVSAPNGKYLNPIAVFMIARLFGFTGWDGRSNQCPDDWGMWSNKDEHCVVLVQECSAMCASAARPMNSE